MPTVTPRVPIQTPMFDSRGLLTRTWVIFFERLGLRSEQAALEAGGKGPFQRTLLVKNSTVGDDIADHTTIYKTGIGVRLTGVLRKAITSPLTVRLQKNSGSTTAAVCTLTIPPSTSVDDPVETTTFTADPMEFVDGDVLSWDITASDDSIDGAGVASFTIEWAPAG